MKKIKYSAGILLMSGALILTACVPESDDKTSDNGKQDNSNNMTSGDGVTSEHVVDHDGKTPVWALTADLSQINFVSTKKIHVVETHHFNQLAGYIYKDNSAVLTIPLDSVDSNVDIRDQRLKQMFFDTMNFPTAVAMINIDVSELDQMQVGDREEKNLSTSIVLHGVTQHLIAELTVLKISNDQIIVRTKNPILLDVLDFDLQSGLDTLKQLASLSSISMAVPVDFILVFKRV
ncbi:MAG: YceI family protein [Pseudomonadales bacterium]|nr:YceI family protein [Pseudomonadales bacterium]